MNAIRTLKLKRNIDKLLADKKGASLWEYLLVIAIVCIIGAALISVISGGSGIAALWTNLFNKFSSLISTAL